MIVCNMEDQVAAALYKRVQACDHDLQAKEESLKRLESVNTELLDILLKSEPLDLKSSKTLGHIQPRTLSQPGASFLPVNRPAWTPCPFRTLDQWIYIVNGKLVVGVELENIRDDMYIADIIGTIMITSGANQEWCSSRSCMLKFDAGESLWPQEKNFLRPGEKALLMVSTPAPSNLLCFELILICQASMRAQVGHGEKFLPPLLEPQHWRHWSGEVWRIGKNTLDAFGKQAPIVPSLAGCFISGRFGTDIKSRQKFLASIYACQEQKRICLNFSGDIKSLLNNWSLQLTNCWSVHSAVKFCRLPLFDGILVFVEHALDNQSHDLDFMITGWTTVQIEQFLSLLNATSSNGIAKISSNTNKDSNGDMHFLDEKYARLLAQLDQLAVTDMDTSDNDMSTVDGREYREVKLDACAIQLAKWL